MSKQKFYSDMKKLNPPYPLIRGLYLRYAVNGPEHRATCPLTALALSNGLTTVDDLRQKSRIQMPIDYIVKGALAKHYGVPTGWLDYFVSAWDRIENPTLADIPYVLDQMKGK